MHTVTPLKTTHRNITPDRFEGQPGEIVELPAADCASVSKPRGGLKKVTFGAVKPKTETKTAYPVLPDPDGQAAEIAGRILENTEQLDALEGALKTDKAELKALAMPFYFETNHGRHEVPSSVSVQSLSGEVLVTFQNRYSLLPDEAGLLPILGDDTEKYFRQSFTLSIKSDKLPEHNAQDFITDLQALAVKYGCTEAIEIKEGVKPTSEFHMARHLNLTPEQNLTLDAACPIICQVKTKGRK